MISIRTAKNEDMAAVARVHGACFPTYFTTKLGKKPAAPAPAEMHREQGDLLSICILDKCRGNGNAKQMVEAFEQQLCRAGIYSYQLSVKADNDRARAFYEKIGMRCNGETGHSVVYTKQLSCPEEAL